MQWVHPESQIPMPPIPPRDSDASPPVRRAVPDGRMLELLVCPVTRGPLRYDAAHQELISQSARLAYPIRDGVAVLVPDEARHLDSPV